MHEQLSETLERSVVGLQTYHEMGHTLVVLPEIGEEGSSGLLRAVVEGDTAHASRSVDDTGVKELLSGTVGCR